MTHAHDERPGHCDGCAEELGRLRARVEALELQAPGGGADLTHRLAQLEGWAKQYQNPIPGIDLPPMPHDPTDIGKAFGAVVDQMRERFGEQFTQQIAGGGVQALTAMVANDLHDLRWCLEQLRENIAGESVEMKMRVGVSFLTPTRSMKNLDDWIDYLTGHYGPSQRIDLALDLLDQEFGSFILVTRKADGNLGALGNFATDADGSLAKNAERAVRKLLQRRAAGTAPEHTLP